MSPMSTDGMNLHVDTSIDIDFIENDRAAPLELLQCAS